MAENLRPMKVGELHGIKTNEGKEIRCYLLSSPLLPDVFRDQPDLAVGELRREVLQVQLARVGHAADAQLHTALVPQHLPGHDVGVVLHLADEHRPVRPHHPAPVAVGDEVDRLRAVAGEDHLARVRGAEEARHGGAGGLVGVGGLLA